MVRRGMSRIGVGWAAIVAASIGGAALAASPAAFGRSAPGLWELSGIDGKKQPVRVCVVDLTELARIEHRGRACKQSLVKQSAASVTYQYQCAGSDFGRTKMDSVTTNNLRIDTQGIAGGLPFAYTVQARRVGDCAPKAAPAGH